MLIRGSRARRTGESWLRLPKCGSRLDATRRESTTSAPWARPSQAMKIDETNAGQGPETEPGSGPPPRIKLRHAGRKLLRLDGGPGEVPEAVAQPEAARRKD